MLEGCCIMAFHAGRQGLCGAQEFSLDTWVCVTGQVTWMCHGEDWHSEVSD